MENQAVVVMVKEVMIMEYLAVETMADLMITVETKEANTVDTMESKVTLTSTDIGWERLLLFSMF